MNNQLDLNIAKRALGINVTEENGAISVHTPPYPILFVEERSNGVNVSTPTYNTIANIDVRITMNNTVRVAYTNNLRGVFNMDEFMHVIEDAVERWFQLYDIEQPAAINWNVYSVGLKSVISFEYLLEDFIDHIVIHQRGSRVIARLANRNMAFGKYSEDGTVTWHRLAGTQCEETTMSKSTVELLTRKAEEIFISEDEYSELVAELMCIKAFSHNWMDTFDINDPISIVPYLEYQNTQGRYKAMQHDDEFVPGIYAVRLPDGSIRAAHFTKHWVVIPASLCATECEVVCNNTIELINFVNNL